MRIASSKEEDSRRELPSVDCQELLAQRYFTPVSSGTLATGRVDSSSSADHGHHTRPVQCASVAREEDSTRELSSVDRLALRASGRST